MSTIKIHWTQHTYVNGIYLFIKCSALLIQQYLRILVNFLPYKIIYFNLHLIPQEPFGPGHDSLSLSYVCFILVLCPGGYVDCRMYI